LFEALKVGLVKMPTALLVLRARNLYRRALRWLFRDVVNDVWQNCYLVFGPLDRLRIQPTAVVSNAQFNTISGSITIEEHAFGDIMSCY